MFAEFSRKKKLLKIIKIQQTAGIGNSEVIDGQ
jgi:hypothetical protein